jgi:hypothetical protein
VVRAGFWFGLFRGFTFPVESVAAIVTDFLPFFPELAVAVAGFWGWLSAFFLPSVVVFVSASLFFFCLSSPAAAPAPPSGLGPISLNLSFRADWLFFISVTISFQVLPAAFISMSLASSSAVKVWASSSPCLVILVLSIGPSVTEVVAVAVVEASLVAAVSGAGFVVVDVAAVFYAACLVSWAGRMEISLLRGSRSSCSVPGLRPQSDHADAR